MGWVVDRIRYVHTTDARIAADVVLLSAETGARIVHVTVTPGDMVQAGDTLIQLDDREAQLELARLESELAGLEAEIRRETRRAVVVREAGAGRVVARESNLDASAADLRAARALLGTAEADHARMATLFHAGVVARPAFDQATNRLEDARRQLNVAQAARRQRAGEVHEAIAEGDQTTIVEAQVDALVHAASAMRHRIAMQRIAVRRHVVSAPLAGVVDEVFVEVGELATTGARLVLMHDPASVRIEASVKETDIGRVKPGADVRLKFDAWPDHRASGKVDRIREVAASQLALVPPANPAGVFTKITQRVPVRISIDYETVRDGAVLRPGGMATVKIAADAR